MRRLQIVALGLVLLFAACDSESDQTSTTTTTAATADADDPSTTTTGAADAETIVEVVVESGRVVGGVQRVEVAAGDEVVLRVTSDIADEIHLHGYEVKVDVEAGATTDLRFTAEIPGVFEAELEAAGLKLAEFEVRP